MAPIKPSLKATGPDPLILDVDGGQPSGTTTFEYWKEPHQNLWFRDRPGAWRPLDLQLQGINDPKLTHDDKHPSTELEPGQVYEVTIWDESEDPNNPSVEPRAMPLAELAIFALRKNPHASDFFDSEDLVIGGTRRTHYIFTKQPVNAWEAVSTSAPGTGSSGEPTLAPILSSTWASMKSSHDLVVRDLIPGTHYHVLTRLSDEHGNWQFLSGEFDARLRLIELKVASIFINDDSDGGGRGEGEIKFSIETGPVDAPERSWTARGSVSYQGDYSTGDTVNAPTEMVNVGPEAVTPNNVAIRARIDVVDDDSTPIFITDDDEAWGFTMLESIDDVTESVIDRKVSLVAGPGTGDLKISTEVQYSVKYV
jgi:hypothetical protein